MFKCKRTNEVVTVSDNPNYVFTNNSLDEDLMLFETYLAVSNTAKEEAAALTISTLPSNFSHNRELLAAVKCKDLHGVLLSIDNNTRPLEYCEAVCVQVFINEY